MPDTLVVHEHAVRVVHEALWGAVVDLRPKGPGVVPLDNDAARAGLVGLGPGERQRAEDGADGGEKHGDLERVWIPKRVCEEGLHPLQ